MQREHPTRCDDPMIRRKPIAVTIVLPGLSKVASGALVFRGTNSCQVHNMYLIFCLFLRYPLTLPFPVPNSPSCHRRTRVLLREQLWRQHLDHAPDRPNRSELLSRVVLLYEQLVCPAGTESLRVIGAFPCPLHRARFCGPMGEGDGGCRAIHF